MPCQILHKLLTLLTVLGTLTFLGATVSQATIEFDRKAIEAEITAAVAAGAKPNIAAKAAVANAVRSALAKNNHYPGGRQALSAEILKSVDRLNVPGLNRNDRRPAARHGMGITVDPALAAYEAPGEAGRRNARERGGKAYGRRGCQPPASPI